MLDRIREELLTIQKSLEPLENRDPSDLQEMTGAGNDGVE